MKKIDYNRAVVINVDVQKAFGEEAQSPKLQGLRPTEKAEVENAAKLSSAAYAAGAAIVVTQDWHNTPGTVLPDGKIDDRAKDEFEIYGEHSVGKTPDAELSAPLAKVMTKLDRGEAPAGGAEGGGQRDHGGDGVARGGLGGEAIGYDDNEIRRFVARGGGERGKFYPRRLVEPAAQVGAQQVGATVGHGGGEGEGGQAGGGEFGDDGGGVEGGENGVAGAGMGEAEGEDGFRALAATGPAERDAGGGEAAQVEPGIAGSRGQSVGNRGGGGGEDGHGKGEKSGRRAGCDGLKKWASRLI